MATMVDPVCGKVLETDEAAARTERQGKTYFFCSEECRDAFEADPEHHLERLPDPVCAVCGGAINRDDLVCPHCGTSLVSG